MKNIWKNLIAFLFLINLFSCVEDESLSNNENINEVETSSDALEGTWSITDYSVSNGTINVKVINTIITQSFTVSSSNYDYTETYSDDTSEVTIEGSYDVAVTIANVETIDHTVNTTNIENKGISLTSDWILENGNKVTITNDEIVSYYTITSINEKELKYSVDLSTLDAEQINIFFGEKIAQKFDDGTFSSMTGTLFVTLEM